MEVRHADQRRSALLRHHDIRHLLQTRARVCGWSGQPAVRILVLLSFASLRFVLPMGPQVAPAALRKIHHPPVWIISLFFNLSPRITCQPTSQFHDKSR